MNKQFLLKLAPLGILLVIYLVFSIYVKNVLENGSIDVGEKKTQVTEYERKPANLTLHVESAGVTTPAKPSRTINIKGETTDTVLDILERLRDSEELFFEKVSYSYGTVLEQVEGTNLPDGYVWSVTLDLGNVRREEIQKGLFDTEQYALLSDPEVTSIDITTDFDAFNIIHNSEVILRPVQR